MLDSVRKQVSVRAVVPVDALIGLGTVVSFVWLLAQDRIHPLAIYLLQLYLSF